MALKDGHHRTKRREGTRNCFYCRRDIVGWQQLTWPQIKEIYDHCGVKCPTALCCDDCYKNKPNKDLYRIFWATLLAIECENYRKKQPTIIKDGEVYKMFLSMLREHKKYLLVDLA